MIAHGLSKTIELYSNEINLFYDNIDKYFKQIILRSLNQIPLETQESIKILGALKSLLISALNKFGLENEEIESHFMFFWKTEVKKELEALTDVFQMYEKFSPILYKIFLEKIINYLVGNEANSIVMRLKSKQFLPIEFLINLKQLKQIFDKSSEKKVRLKKYLLIREKILSKLKENKESIEEFQNLPDPREKLQLSYIVYQIIDFFNLKNIFDFKTLKSYIKKEYDEWLDTIPLVSLKNPDLYYCGVYLAKSLEIPIDMNKIKYFLLNIYDENIDEFEAPIIEATNQVYYFFESSWIAGLQLSDHQIRELLKGNDKFFQTTYLKNLETSQLVIILKIYNQLGLYEKIEKEKIRQITSEIEKRISDDGIKQFRDGFMSAEATYHVLFIKYIRNELDKIKTPKIIDKIISRIFRNLQLIDFSKEINYDLLTELYYACKSLQLLNCTEVKNMVNNLARHLFPEEVIKSLLKNGKLKNKASKLRELKISRVTGELIQGS